MDDFHELLPLLKSAIMHKVSILFLSSVDGTIIKYAPADGKTKEER